MSSLVLLYLIAIGREHEAREVSRDQMMILRSVIWLLLSLRCLCDTLVCVWGGVGEGLP